MKAPTFKLLCQDKPTELWVEDCSLISAQDIMGTIQDLDCSNLQVLKLDRCGDSFSDEVAQELSKKNLTKLTLSLRLATGWTEIGKLTLLSSISSLVSLDLRGCVISSEIRNLIGAKFGPTLSKIYLDGCAFEDIGVLGRLPSFSSSKLASLADLPNWSNSILGDFLTLNGRSSTNLNISECGLITDNAVKKVAQVCSDLLVLNISDLPLLSNLSLGFLSFGCRKICNLNISRHFFQLSDEAVAAFIEIAGEFLLKLILNGTKNAGFHTANAIARTCKSLSFLDVSFCDNFTDQDLGSLVDKCVSLELLVIVGCSRVTKAFKNGHSNPHLRVVDLFGATRSELRFSLTAAEYE